MQFGVAVPNYGETASREGILEVANEAEGLGFDSLWTTDHVLMPHGSGTPYERIYESLTTLAYLAASTKRVKLGVSALIIAMRNPVVAFKQLVTIDALSEGRAMVAIGAGWNAREFSNLGCNFGTRGKRVNESIRLLRELCEGRTSFTGKETGIDFRDAEFEPIVSKRIPVWIGGVSKAAMHRAAKLGDAWHPNVFPLEDFRRLVSQFRGIPGAQNKPIHVRIGVNAKSPVGEYIGAQGERRISLSANAEENRKIVEALRDLRIEGIVAATSPLGTTRLADQLDGLRMIHDQLMSA